jgi:hypothetical protein
MGVKEDTTSLNDRVFKRDFVPLPLKKGKGDTGG